MIPTVEDILLMLARKECTHEQALGWMEQHFAATEQAALSSGRTPDCLKPMSPEAGELLGGVLDDPAPSSKEPLCSVCAGTGKPASSLPCICGGVGTQAAEAQGLREALYAVRSASRTPVWIPVSERLPETRIRVLARNSLLVEVMYVDHDGKWKNDAGTPLRQEHHIPTEWQPLPSVSVDGTGAT